MEETFSLKTVMNGVPCNDLVQYNVVTECPQCGSKIHPEVIRAGVFQRKDLQVHLSLICICRSCDRSFIVQYSDGYEANLVTGHKGTIFDHIDFIEPKRFKGYDFEQIIDGISPDFVKIFNQSLAAESSGLDQIAGIGYRKSLEFLIKDFLIKTQPDNEDRIRKSMLGNCIKDFVDDKNLKTTASRAVWLGNDQTHYEQKYTDKDLSDLRKLIRISVYWISIVLETKEAEDIPHPNSF